MQTYQIKVLPQNTFLYGGVGITVGNESDGPVLLVKNDRFGEPIQIKVVSQKPAQPATTTDFGILAPDQVFTLNLKFVLQVEAKTLAHNLDSFVTCTVNAKPAI